MPVAIVLSGGGAQGDFEVGVVQYLVAVQVKWDIVSGTSVGAINAVKLAEGGNAVAQRKALTELEGIWEGLQDNSYMYIPEPWFGTLDPVIQLFLSGSIGPAIGNFVTGLLADAINPIGLLVKLADLGIDIGKLGNAMDAAKKAQSFYDLSPIGKLLRINLNEANVHSSGVKLRLAMVSLETGAVRFVDERGKFIDGQGGDPPDLATAALASAAIPAIFPAVNFGGQTYVDGGIRDVLPIDSAVQAGADMIFAVSASHLAVGQPPLASYANANIFDIASRAVEQIMTAQIGLAEAYPPGFGFSVTSLWQPGTTCAIQVICPRVDIHDTMTIDPGLIRIRFAYGYMTADDSISPSDDDYDLGQQVTDKIASLRKDTWNWEIQLFKATSAGIDPAQYYQIVRQNKTSLRQLALAKQQLLGALPPDVNNWWSQWEAHPFQPSRNDPWMSWPPSVPAATPPSPLTAINVLLHFSRAAGNSSFQLENLGGSVGGTPSVMNYSSGMHVFARAVDGSFLEFLKSPGSPQWLMFDHSADPGIQGLQIAGSPSAVVDSAQTLHVFVRGQDGSLLEFQKQVGSNLCTAINHSKSALGVPAGNLRGITGIRIAGNAPAFWDANKALHVFGNGTDGSMLLFSAGAGGSPWQVFPIWQLPIATVNQKWFGNVLLDSSGAAHLFSRMASSFGEIYLPSSGPIQVFDHSSPQDTGVSISGVPVAIADSGGNFHIFARGTDGSLLEFTKAPSSTTCGLKNHNDVQNSSGVGVVSSNPTPVFDPGGSLHVFARGFDGRLIEFLNQAGTTVWQAFNRSSDANVGNARIAGTPAAVYDSSGVLHVFAVSSNAP